VTVERLQPNLDLLREEYVLVPAWKKTATYICLALPGIQGTSGDR
jgi:hypothetical protein